ncbi:MAG: glycosyltransferase family 4 protein [Blastocatellia bacterium]|nr:glycosyltransferase family 4 protein [Blastocatellia bacterium]
MKILYLTAGAANMYCGSCLRDNALAAELMARKHDVLLVPLYTPTLTDEKNVSQDRIFFGGISVYLQQRVPLFRKTPWLLDRLWDSKFALKLASRSSIPVDPVSLADLTISMLKGEHGHQRKELEKLIHWLETETAPDVVNLHDSMLLALARPIKEALSVPLVCTLQGEDFFLDGLPEAHRREAIELIRENIEFVDAFIAVSEYYADFMCEYLGIPEEKMHVVPLGINLDGYEAELQYPERRGGVSRSRSDVFTIGYFARVAPEKGLHVLCEAYEHLRKRNDFPRSRLEVAGYLAPEHRSYLRGIEQRMKKSGLADEFQYRGALDREGKIAFLRGLDVFSVPTTFNESKGMSLIEAMASGVPVVQPRRGSFSEMIEKTEGGLLVEPDDPTSLAEGILSVWKDAALAEEFSRKGREGVRMHYTVARMADRALEVYGSLVEAKAEIEMGADQVMAECG